MVNYALGGGIKLIKTMMMTIIMIMIKIIISVAKFSIVNWFLARLFHT